MCGGYGHQVGQGSTSQVSVTMNQGFLHQYRPHISTKDEAYNRGPVQTVHKFSFVDHYASTIFMCACAPECIMEIKKNDVHWENSIQQGILAHVQEALFKTSY